MTAEDGNKHKLTFEDRMKGSQCFVIGITGGSGSGKTTIARKLMENVGSDNISLISHDAYYRDLSHLSMPERDEVNFDHPNSLETELFIEHIKVLKSGKSVQLPVYDFTVHCRKEETKTLNSCSVLLVEGILLLTNEKLRDLLDLTVFIDTASDIRFIRRLKRDREERGRSVESITEQYLTSVRPMHNQFVEPFKQYADIILPGEKCLDVAVDVLTIRLKHCCIVNTRKQKPQKAQNGSQRIVDASKGVLFERSGERIM